MISAGIFRTDAANFLGKLAIFFRYQRSIHKEFSKNFRWMFDTIKGFEMFSALVENPNANIKNLLEAITDIDFLTYSKIEWSFELPRTRYTSI